MSARPDPPPYPVNLRLAGRPVLVVGGGTVAARKVRGLVASGAQVTVVAPDVAPEIEDIAGVHVHRRAFDAGDVHGQRLVLTATDDPAVNQAVHDAAEAADVWVNSADDPERCTFTLPAVVRRGPVTVTASTGGASPALSAWLRSRLDAWLPAWLADLAEELRAEREQLQRAGRSTAEVDWPARIDAALDRHGWPT